MTGSLSHAHAQHGTALYKTVSTGRKSVQTVCKGYIWIKYVHSKHFTKKGKKTDQDQESP